MNHNTWFSEFKTSYLIIPLPNTTKSDHFSKLFIFFGLSKIFILCLVITLISLDFI